MVICKHLLWDTNSLKIHVDISFHNKFRENLLHENIFINLILHWKVSVIFTDKCKFFTQNIFEFYFTFQKFYCPILFHTILLYRLDFNCEFIYIYIYIYIHIYNIYTYIHIFQKVGVTFTQIFNSQNVWIYISEVSFPNFVRPILFCCPIVIYHIYIYIYIKYIYI